MGVFSLYLLPRTFGFHVVKLSRIEVIPEFMVKRECVSNTVIPKNIRGKIVYPQLQTFDVYPIKLLFNLSLGLIIV